MRAPYVEFLRLCGSELSVPVPVVYLIAGAILHGSYVLPNARRSSDFPSVRNQSAGQVLQLLMRKTFSVCFLFWYSLVAYVFSMLSFGFQWLLIFLFKFLLLCFLLYLIITEFLKKNLFCIEDNLVREVRSEFHIICTSESLSAKKKQDL